MEGSDSAGDDVGMTPNKIRNQTIMMMNPEITNPFLVPPKFFSNRAIVHVIS